jgi:hypothetical protein
VPARDPDHSQQEEDGLVSVRHLRLGAVGLAAVGSLALISAPGGGAVAYGAAAVPAHGANLTPASGPWTPGRASAHVMRPLGSTAPPSAARVRRDAPNGSGQLVYGFAQIQTQPQLFLDFWGSDFNTDADGGGFTGAQGANYVEDFLNEAIGGPYMGSQTQYCQADKVSMPSNATISSCGGNTHAGVPGGVPGAQIWNDTTTVAPSQPDFGMIGQEADAARTHFGLPGGDINATVIVFSPPGKSTFSDPSIGPFCGFHDFTASTIFAYVPWSPDQGANCLTNVINATNGPLGQGHFDGLSVVTGHEVAETITDPLPNLVVNGTQFFGWADADGLETGDKCQGLQIWPTTDITTTDFFAVQPLWSDAGGSCVMEDIAGSISGHAAIAARDATHRDVFVRGGDGHVYWKTATNDVWSGWQSLGGSTPSSPAAVSWDSNRIDLFVRGGDNGLWHKSWTSTGGWSPNWDGLGGTISTSPAVASWAPNRLDVFVVGTDSRLYHKSWNGSMWSGYDGQGGTITADPAAVSWAPNRIDVFVRGGDSALWHKSWNGSSWSGYDGLGGSFASGFGAASTGAGELQVFGLGGDHKVYRKSFNGSWGGFVSLDGAWPSDPATISPPSTGTRLVELFMIGNTTATVERQILGI